MRVLAIGLLLSLLMRWMPESLHHFWFDEHHQHTVDRLDHGQGELRIEAQHQHCQWDFWIDKPIAPLSIAIVNIQFTTNTLIHSTLIVRSNDRNVKEFRVRGPPVG